MTKYLIPAYEQDGMNIRICCLLINAKDGMTLDDVVEAIKKASTEYCTTPEGRKTYEGNCGNFNYGDFDAYVSNSICKKYGISKSNAKYHYVDPVCFDEQVVDSAVMDDLKLKDEIIEELREQLEEYLQGLVVCDDITREEQGEVLDDFDNWAETAEYGDTYYYDDEEYTIESE